MRFVLLILLALATATVSAHPLSTIRFSGRIVTPEERIDSIKVVDASTADQPKFIVYELDEQIAEFDNRIDANQFAAYRRWLVTHLAV